MLNSYDFGLLFDKLEKAIAANPANPGAPAEPRPAAMRRATNSPKTYPDRE